VAGCNHNNVQKVWKCQWLERESELLLGRKSRVTRPVIPGAGDGERVRHRRESWSAGGTKRYCDFSSFVSRFESSYCGGGSEEGGRMVTSTISYCCRRDITAFQAILPIITVRFSPLRVTVRENDSLWGSTLWSSCMKTDLAYCFACSSSSGGVT